MYDRITKSNLIVMTGFILLSNTTVAAGKSPTSLDGKAYLGRSYDSNVSLPDDSNLPTQIGDHSTNIGLSLGLDHNFSKKIDMSISHSLSDKRYDQFSEFDLRTNLSGVSFNVKPSKNLKLGLSAHHANAKLDGKNYLSMNKFSPSLSWFTNKRTYIRLAYNHTDKSFTDRPTRDAKNNGLSANGYIFLNSTKNFLSLGYDFKQEDAVDNTYDYNAHTLKAAWVSKMAWFSQEEKLKISARYENRAYDDIDSVSNNSARNDDRYRYSIRYTVTPTKYVYTEFEYEYSDYLSSEDAYTYDQQLITVSIGGKF